MALMFLRGPAGGRRLIWKARDQVVDSVEGLPEDGERLAFRGDSEPLSKPAPSGRGREPASIEAIASAGLPIGLTELPQARCEVAASRPIPVQPLRHG